MSKLKEFEVTRYSQHTEKRIIKAKSKDEALEKFYAGEQGTLLIDEDVDAYDEVDVVK